MDDLSLLERLLVPALITGIFALLSGGFMVVAGGATQRMKIVLLGAVLFVGGMGYSMAWHDKLAALFGWDSAWIALSVVVAIACIYLCRRLLARRSDISQSL